MSSEQIQELIIAVKQTTKEWLTIQDLENEFGIPRQSQSKMRMAKKLPFSKIGKYVRYKRSDINKLFEDARIV
jgi:hypothetical protein